MAKVSAARLEAVKHLLKRVIQASLAAARALQKDVVEQHRARRLNIICGEFMSFHMWRAFERARQRLIPDEFQWFKDYAINNLSFAAGGLFTGTKEAKAQEEFAAAMGRAFAEYVCCGPELVASKDPLTSNSLLSTLARTVAERAGRKGEARVIMAAIVAGMESINATRIEDGVEAVVRH